MKEKRYYYNGTIYINSIVTLEDEEFHHLVNVMRSRVGEKVCLFNGDGNFYFGEVKSINKKYAEIMVTSAEKSNNEPSIKLTIYQALAKGDKMSLVMQKITEIGASTLCLFESEFCDVKANTHRQDRLDTISVSAAKQCGRASLVQTKGIYKFNEVAEQIADFDAFYVAYEAEDGSTLASSLIENKNNLKNIAIMIGAEGGFSQKEIELLKNNNAKIVSLGNRILRTETASIVCAGLAMQILETT
ncbi:MAG: 16S rRNA (uracil(1498)-N(3))-methyltransferase [Clostridia bacterium]|nr:16S rRNA (uracil(1498)-N(3))-methyltransferase [Clostridiales bacterium]MBQ7917311.1 16S rRNA (uracil(1498)-N(3))-methyltransferase [Clostridia bacterium]